MPRRLYGSDAERDIQEGREELREEESGEEERGKEEREEERGKEEREEERGQLRRILTEGEGQEQRVAMETTQALLAVETGTYYVYIIMCNVNFNVYVMSVFMLCP